MQKNEIELYSKYLKKAKNLFEFGAGNSTLYAETFSNIENIYSIDNDKKWCDYIKSTSSTNKINITYINTGPIKNFGIPLNETKFDDGNPLKKLQPNYYNFINNIDIDVDTILIDGRWRVMSGIKTWEKYKEKDVTVIIHDYLDRKHYYGVLDNYYEIIESAGTLVVTKPKKENIELNYSKYLFDWS